MKCIALCGLDVSHERGEVFDPGVQPLFCLVVVSICPARLPVEKVHGVGVEFGGVGDRRACFPIVGAEGEKVDAHSELVMDVWDRILGHRVWYLIETLLREEAIVPEWALGMIGSRM